MSSTQPSSSNNAAAPAAGPTQAQAKFELAIVCLLYLWPTLRQAVRDQWGGYDSEDKRAWVADQVAELFRRDPRTQQEDVEDMVLQVMGDEFDCKLEDDAEVGIARAIMRYRTLAGQGDYAEIDQLYQRWQTQGKAPVLMTSGHEVLMNYDGQRDHPVANPAEGNGESDDESESDEEGEDDGDQELDDVEMEDAAGPSQPGQRQEPEIDEDGFQTVVGKRRR